MKSYKRFSILYIALALLLAGSTIACGQPAAPKAVSFEVLPAEIPMGDGARLAADIYLPARDKASPAVLIMTPYNKALYNPSIINAMQANNPESAFFPTSDYAMVIIDWRGKFGSKDASPLLRTGGQGMDGYDTVEWIARQPWCNGKVAMWGQSAMGIIQYQTAAKKPPHLVTIMPWIANIGDSYEAFHHGGVPRKELIDMLGKIGFPGLSQLISAHPLDDSLYRLMDYAKAKDIEVPALIIGGWFDIYDITKVFNELKRNGSEKVKKYHRVIIGPWTHIGAGKDIPQGELEFEDTGLFVKNEQKKFFDHWLKGINNGADKAPAVTYYQLGENRWYASDTWPPPGVQETAFYLQADNQLSQSEPPSQSQSKQFVSDPSNPVPTIGGNNLNFTNLIPGPADQREKVESHKDVLIYTTDALQQDLAIAGNIKARLYVSSDCEDTDVAIRVTDVYPDGRSILLSDGIQHLSLMKSYSEENFITPGEIYSVTIETPAIAATFLKGHRIRLIVSSSNYPRFDVNTNTRDKSGPPRIATNALYHDASYPSALILPVLNR